MQHGSRVRDGSEPARAPRLRDLTLRFRAGSAVRNGPAGVIPFNTGAKPAFTGLQYKSGSPVGSAKVVGVIETFKWDGGVGDMISLDFYVSQQNAVAIKSSQQHTLTTRAINSLAWWIVDYDQQAKMWFEQAYPVGGSVTGLVAGQGGNLMLNVGLVPVTAKIDKVSLAVEPGANRAYELQFAESSKIKVVKPWGLVATAPRTGA